MIEVFGKGRQSATYGLVGNGRQLANSSLTFAGSQHARVTAVTDQSRLWTKMIYKTKITNQPLTDSLQQLTLCIILYVACWW